MCRPPRNQSHLNISKTHMNSERLSQHGQGLHRVVCIYTYIHTYIHTHTYIYIYTYIYTHIHAYIHIHAHIYVSFILLWDFWVWKLLNLVHFLRLFSFWLFGIIRTKLSHHSKYWIHHHTRKARHGSKVTSYDDDGGL